MLKDLIKPNESKILLLVADGLGGMPNESGRTEMEAAPRAHLDELASKSSLGLTDPIATGVTPGSVPAHLALFGYDPHEFRVGRGAVEARGLDIKLIREDLCIRANFCTVDRATGVVTDRRAGRIPTAKNEELVARIRPAVAEIDGIEVLVHSGMEYRFVVVLRGKGLSTRISESDPEKEGFRPRPITALAWRAEKTSEVINGFLKRAADLIKDEEKANYILLRGYSKPPDLEPMNDRYWVKAACVAAYPAYKGLARILGMAVLDNDGTWEGELNAVEQNLDRYDFFFMHLKELDKLGEDGKFAEKVEQLGRLDALVPRITRMGFDVIVITGDHSTPAVLKAHSWHPNPFLLWSPWVRREGKTEFTERGCARGQLGRMPALEVMPLILANARKLAKFGA